MVVTMRTACPGGTSTGWPGRTRAGALESVDPGGAIAAAIEPGRVIGCVVYPAAELLEPGVVRDIEGNRFSLGEPDGSAARASRRFRRR